MLRPAAGDSPDDVVEVGVGHSLGDCCIERSRVILTGADLDLGPPNWAGATGPRTSAGTGPVAVPG